MRNDVTSRDYRDISADAVRQAILGVADCRSLIDLRNTLFCHIDSLIGVAAMGLYLFDSDDELRYVASCRAPQADCPSPRGTALPAREGWLSACCPVAVAGRTLPLVHCGDQAAPAHCATLSLAGRRPGAAHSPRRTELRRGTPADAPPESA